MAEAVLLLIKRTINTYACVSEATDWRPENWCSKLLSTIFVGLSNFDKTTCHASNYIGKIGQYFYTKPTNLNLNKW